MNNILQNLLGRNIKHKHKFQRSKDTNTTQTHGKIQMLKPKLEVWRRTWLLLQSWKPNDFSFWWNKIKRERATRNIISFVDPRCHIGCSTSGMPSYTLSAMSYLKNSCEFCIVIPKPVTGICILGYLRWFSKLSLEFRVFLWYFCMCMYVCNQIEFIIYSQLLEKLLTIKGFEVHEIVKIRIYVMRMYFRD